MTQFMLALSLGFGGVILATQIGFAQPQCDTRANVIEQLAQTYGEHRRSTGLAANAMVMDLFAANATGTWTLTVTTPDGQMCLVASGEGFEAVAEGLPAKGAKI